MYKESIFAKRDIQALGISIICIFSFLFFTDPNDLPVLVLLILPLLVSFFAYYFTNIIIRSVSNLSLGSRRIISSSVSLLVLTIFMLGALKQLNIQDVMLVLIIVSGLSFYVSRHNFLMGD